MLDVRPIAEAADMDYREMYRTWSQVSDKGFYRGE